MDKKCCICGKSFTEYGNDPWPVEDKGACCDYCNYAVVLPARIRNLYARTIKKEGKV